MLHASTTVPLDGDRVLLVGFVWCFSEPTLSVMVAKKKPAPDAKLDILSEFLVPRDRIAGLIDALQQVQAAMPKAQ